MMGRTLSTFSSRRRRPRSTPGSPSWTSPRPSRWSAYPPPRCRTRFPLPAMATAIRTHRPSSHMETYSSGRESARTAPEDLGCGGLPVPRRKRMRWESGQGGILRSMSRSGMVRFRAPTSWRRGSRFPPRARRIRKCTSSGACAQPPMHPSPPPGRNPPTTPTPWSPSGHRNNSPRTPWCSRR